MFGFAAPNVGVIGRRGVPVTAQVRHLGDGRAHQAFDNGSATKAARTSSPYAGRVGSDEFPYEAKRRVVALIETLEPMVKRDPEQEIRGVAVPVLEATIEVLKGALPHDPVVAAVVGAYAA